MIRTYSELSKLKTFQERFDYLKLGGSVGEDTFGFDRYINQLFYQSREWKMARGKVILRDNGMDLGLDGYTIFDKILVHHMNPISMKMIDQRDPSIWDPEYLICVSNATHNAIHYGGKNPNDISEYERMEGDTLLWKPVS